MVTKQRPEVPTEDNHPFPNLYKLGKTKHGLFLGCPVWRQTEMEWHVSMTQFYALAFNLGLHFFDYPMIGDALIQRSRSRSASDFLKTDAQVFVQVDSDIAFSPLDILKIAEATFTHDIVGGAYTKRMQEKTQLALRTYNPTVIEFTEQAELTEVEYLSGGFYAVHRRVLEKLLKTHADELPLCHAKEDAFYPFFHDKFKVLDDNTLMLSEDWAFFERCREAGYKCYVDPSVRLGHVGNYTYTLEDMGRRPRPESQGIRYTRHEDGRATLEGTGASPTEEIITTADGFKMHIIPGDKMISESIRQSGYWDKEVRDTIHSLLQPEWTFLDLGAHFGYFSLLAASFGSKVIAVEPNPVMTDLLKKSAELNDFSIELYQCAVSDYQGTQVLVTEGIGNNGMSYLSDGGKPGNQVVVSKLSDFLGIPFPEMIKIDIEGEEVNALKSEPEILEAAKVIIFEVSEQQLARAGSTEKQLKNILRAAGFKLSLIKQHDTYADWLGVKKNLE